MVTTMSLRMWLAHVASYLFVRLGRSGSVRMLSVAGHSAGDLDDHPKVALGVEVGDVNPAELTAEDHFVLTLCLRDGLVEIRGGDGNMVDALTFLGKETGIDALLLERLDKLPHHLADRGDGDARGALGRLTVFAVVVRLTKVDLSELPRADPVVVFVPPYRRLQIAHDDPELHGLGEGRLAHWPRHYRSPFYRVVFDGTVARLVQHPPKG